jgi:predicted small secreted protein
MKRRIEQAGLSIAVLLVSLLVGGCQTFRPRGYQPPKDSYEYIMQRDGGAAQKGQENPDLRWVGDAIVGLLKTLTHSDR